MSDADPVAGHASNRIGRRPRSNVQPHLRTGRLPYDAVSDLLTGVEIVNAIQDVYLCGDVTVA